MGKTIASLVFVVLMVGAASAQSLGDIAKKTQEERAKKANDQPTDAEKNPPKVYSNKDLKEAPQPATSALVTPPSTEPSSTPPAATTTPAAEKAPIGSDPKNEGYWRNRMRPLAAQLSTDVAAAGKLSARYEELRTRFNGMKTVFQQQLVAPEMFKVQTELKAADDQVATDRRAIDALIEEGRVAGALPGWFR